MVEKWKSPREIEDEVTSYLQGRFEYHYQRWENGEISREEMVKAMENESNEFETTEELF